ncbi:hypothetical protein ACQKM1_22315 [Peribacillus frigoritolerans]|uniref:hypothetical protein n=1 Tax=Peribacillus frigoritolerans TaxID=450367 RepID=UPI003D01CCDB
MPKPPMNDVVKILIPNGEKDDYGRDSFTSVISVARVKYASSLHLNNEGGEFRNTVVVDLPPETFVDDGYSVEWINRNGETITGAVEGIEEFLNYPGTVVYYRKAYVNKKPVGFRFG